MNIQGVCPVLSVPFHKTGEVDYQSFKSLVSWITSLGTQSVLFFGVASENIKLSDDNLYLLFRKIDRDEDAKIVIYIYIYFLINRMKILQ